MAYAYIFTVIEIPANIQLLSCPLLAQTQIDNSHTMPLSSRVKR